MSDMMQAEVYIEQTAVCPYCGHHNQGVEWAEERDDGKEEWACEKCGKEFKYAHPENQYGHAF